MHINNDTNIKNELHQARSEKWKSRTEDVISHMNSEEGNENTIKNSSKHPRHPKKNMTVSFTATLIIPTNKNLTRYFELPLLVWVRCGVFPCVSVFIARYTRVFHYICKQKLVRSNNYILFKLKTTKICIDMKQWILQVPKPGRFWKVKDI